MIVCTKCGFQNEDADTFCGSCAGFLEWAGERVAEEAPPEPEPEPEPELEAAHQGIVERVRDRIGIGEARTTDEAAAQTAPAGVAGTEVSVPALAVATAAPGEGETATAVSAAAPATAAGAGAPSAVALPLEAPVEERETEESPPVEPAAPTGQPAP
ncbi:MAG: hypothetical protein ACRDYY_11235, partial [Acidimicrobiales bacterium]